MPHRRPPKRQDPTPITAAEVQWISAAIRRCRELGAEDTAERAEHELAELMFRYRAEVAP
jgi:hypothetical protein